MKTNKITAVPRLRFPEFQGDGDWEIKQLGKVATFSKGKGLPKSYIDDKGTLPCIHYGELFTRYSEVINEVISFTNVKEKWVLSEENDVLMPTSDVTPKGLAKASCINKSGIILGGDILVIRTDKSIINGEFLSRYIRLREQKVLQYVTGSTVYHLYASAINKLPLYLPHYNEQQKIADCSSSLDTLIQAENEQLNALKEYKAGLIQQLFPAEGETTPKRRFAEFEDDGDWEEVKLGELCKILMCKRVFTDQTNSLRGVPFYKIGTLGSSPDAFISRDLYEDYKSRYNFPKKGEVLLTCSGTVGKTIIYDGEDAYYQDSNIVWLDNPKQRIKNELLYYIVSNINWGILNSTTITRIYGDDLRRLNIQFPSSSKEQQKIVDCLFSLDNLIQAKDNQIDALKEHKRGLMQQLFPVMDGE